MKLKAREIALTGATGFIGSMLVSQLVSAGWTVRALYRPKKGRKPPVLTGVKWIAGELKDAATLDSFLEGAYAIIHCAGVVRGVSSSDFDKVNEAGVASVALAATRQDPMPRFLLISSLAARMPGLSHYAASKRRGETAIKAVSPELKWSIIRPPAVYGPGDRELLPLFRSIANGFAPLPAGANGRFSMIHVADLTAAMVCWLSADSGFGETFEIDDGQPLGYDWNTVLEIGSRVLREGAVVRLVPIPVIIFRIVAVINVLAARIFGYAPMLSPGKVREITHPDWVCTTNEFSRITGWKPVFGLEKGLASLFKKEAG